MANFDGIVADLFPNGDPTQAVVQRAAKENPVQIARDARVARNIKADIGFVGRNPKDAAAIERQRKVDVTKLRSEAPKTHEWFSNYYDAAMSIEDVPQLTVLEQSAKALRDVGANIEAAPFSLASGLYGALETGAKFGSQHLTKPIAGLAQDIFGYQQTPTDPLQTVADYFQYLRKDTKASADALTVGSKEYGLFGKSALSGVQSAVQSLGLLGGAAAMGNPALALDAFLAQTLGSTATNATDKGVPLDKAVVYGLSQGIIEKYTEKFSLGALVDMMKGKSGFGQQVVNFMAKEMAGEQIATALQDANDFAILPENKGKNIGDYLKERPSAALSTAIATVVGGSLQIGAVKGTSMAFDKLAKRNTRNVNDRINEGVGAIEAKGHLDKMAETVANTKLNEISPEDMKRYLHHVAGDQTVSLAAEDAATFFQSNPEAAQRLQEDAPEVYAQLAVSEATGSDVVIPTEDYLTSLLAWHEALSDKLKIGDNNISYAEYSKSADALISEIQDAAGQAVADATSEFSQSAQQVQSSFADSLKATGRYTDDAVEHYANLVGAITTTMAARTGMTPEAFAEKYKLLAQTPDHQIEQANRKANEIDQAIYAIRSGSVPTDSQVNGQSLVEFLREEGGLQDSGGELAARDVNGTDKPFQKGLIQEQGNTLDTAAGMAQAAGYLPERDINALLDAIDNELRGNPTYSHHNYNQEMDAQQRTVGDVQQRLHALGIDDISNMSNAEVRDALGADYYQGDSTEPLITLIGDEVLSLDSNRKDAAKKYYDEHLRGTHVDSRIGNIIFSGKGWSKLKNEVFFNELKAQLIPAIKQIISKGEYSGRVLLHKQRKDGIVAFHYFSGVVRIGDRLIDARIDVAEDNRGNKFFSIEKVVERVHGKQTVGLNNLSRNITGDQGKSSGGEFFQRTPSHRTLNMADLPDSMDEVVNHTSLSALQSKEGSSERSEYLAAKNDGDVSAALNVVDRVLKPAVIENIRKQLDPGKKPIFVTPVRQQEGGAMNALPLVYAQRLAIALDGKVTSALVKVTGGKNTGKTQADRLMDKHGYDGEIPDPNGQYIIVDDNFTSGNTTVPLIELIQSQGGTVPVISTLAISRYGKSFKPKQAKIDQLLQQTGLTKDAIDAIVGHGIENLTGTEVQILLNATRQGDGEAKLRRIFASRGASDGRGDQSSDQGTRRQPSPNSLTPPLGQQNRGSIQFPTTDLTNGASLLTLFESADLSTVLHEMGHFYFEVMNHIAQQPDAPQSIVDDMHTLLDYAGVESLEAWNAMDIDQRRAAHEKTAEAFEQYLIEGKAPTSKLRQLFRTLKSWMLAVYRNTRPGAKINADVRAVFDRLIASQDEIDSSRQEIAGEAMFSSAEDAGMSDADYAVYLESVRQTAETADEKLAARSIKDMKWLTGALNRTIKRMQEEAKLKRKVMRAEVADSIYAQPVYAAWRYLTRGIAPEGSNLAHARLSTAALRDMYGKDEDALWRQLPIKSGKYAMVAKDGIHPDDIAPLFGYDSGDALVRALVDAEKPSTVIERETDRRMLQRYGDLVDENAMREAAMDELHNAYNAKVTQAEYAALQKRLGRNDNLKPNAVRDYAETVIGDTKVMELQPHRYLTAERKAARAAMTALGKGDIEEAAKQKRIQRIQQALYSAATRAKKEAERAVNYANRFNSPTTRKNIDPEYMDQIDAILESYDFRKSISNKAVNRGEALQAWIEAQQEQGLEPDFTAAILARKQHYKTLTIDELRGVRDAIRQIHHFGKLKHKLLMMADKREFDAIVDDAVASIEEQAKREVIPSINEKRLWDASKKFGRELLFGHRKFSSLIRQLDGYQEGGVMWQLFTRSANERNSFEVTANQEDGKRLQELMHRYTMGKDGLKQAAHKLTLGTVSFNAKFTVRKYIDAIGHSLSLEERLSIALNWGAEVNRDRIRDGGFTNIGPLTNDQVQAVLDTLSQEDWDFVQGVWQLMEEKWPAMAQLEREVSGTTPEKKVTAEVQTRFGTIQGGYYPIQFSDDKAQKQSAADMLKEQKRGLYGKAQTKQGHLKHTVDDVKRPLRMDFGVVSKHLQQVNHDLAWRKWGLDATRLLRSHRMQTAITGHYSREYLKEIEEAVNDTILGDVPAIDAFEKALSHVRNGASVAAMGWSLTTALVQPLGLTQSIVRVGAGSVAKGIRKYVAGGESMKATVKMVHELSPMMKSRESTMTREVNDVINEAARNGSLTALKESYFWLIGKTQVYIVDMPTWLGAYQKALDSDFDPDTAVALADQAVLDSQTGGNIKDLARVQRGSPLKKLFTNFYSYFSGTLNMSVESYQRTDFKKPSDIAALAVDYLMLYTLPAVLSAAVFAALRGDDGDDEDMLPWLLKLHGSYIANLFVGIREVSGAIEGGFGYNGPAGLRIFGDAANLIKQGAQGEVDRALVKAAYKTAGVAFHFPTSQIIRTGEGFEAFADGKAPLSSIAFGKPRN